MSHWPQVSVQYDGSFAGFLCCVAHCFQEREYPFYFLEAEEQQSLYPLRQIETDEHEAKRVYADLKDGLSRAVRQTVEYAFLTCLPRRERHIFDYIYAHVYGKGIVDPLDERVFLLTKAIRHMMGECEKLQGFVRFSDYQGLLVSEIEPKNRVLPLLRPHFCARFAKERFLIYDRTHREALCFAEGTWKMLPLDALELDAPDAEEERMRALWKQFYHSVSIRDRYNPRAQNTHLPKRYRAQMTEFQ